MANNRITYATAQVSIKDTKKRPTTVIENWYPQLTLASGISATDGEIRFNEVVSGVWPVPHQFRVGDEYIYFTTFLDQYTVGGLTRGDRGTTAATHASGAAADLNGWYVPMGMQTCSISTAFNTEDIFQIGQLGSYENIETLPNIEVTMERVLDGTMPLWLMVGDPRYTDLKGKTADYKVDVAVNIYPDTQDSARGTPDSVVICSGLYVSAVSYSFSATENARESVTLVGNNKLWVSATSSVVPSGYFPTSEAYDATVVGSGVQRSEDFDRANSVLPTDISSDDHIQSIEVSVDIGREEIYELGSRDPYYWAVSFPLTVTTTFTVITSEGDKVNALANQSNLTNQQIILRTLGGLTIDLGTKNKLSSVSLGDFTTGGDSVECTFEYTNSNAFTVTHTATRQAKNP